MAQSRRFRTPLLLAQLLAMLLVLADSQEEVLPINHQQLFIRAIGNNLKFPEFAEVAGPKFLDPDAIPRIPNDAALAAAGAKAKEEGKRRKDEKRRTSTKTLPHTSPQSNNARHLMGKVTESLTARSDLRKRDRADRERDHDLIIAIRPKRTLEELDAMLMSISDPFSVSYGSHMTKEEVGKLTENKEGHDYVIRHLETIGATIVKETRYGDYIHAKAPVYVWEELLDTEFHVYEQTTLRARGSGGVETQDNKKQQQQQQQQQQQKEVEEEVVPREHLRCNQYSLSGDLHTHIQLVLNTVQLPLPIASNIYPKLLRRQQGKDEDVSTIPNPYPNLKNGTIPNPNLNADPASSITSIIYGYITPARLDQGYSIGNNTGSGGTSQGVYASNGQYFSPSDLTVFQKTFGLPVQKVKTSIGLHSSDSQCVSDGNNCMESNLDLQYLTAVAQSTPTTFWYDTDWMANWLFSVGNAINPPKVLSISYGSTEPHVDQSAVFNIEALKLGLQGVTILASSGDDGANTALGLCNYVPSFPASSPYVTAVGATQGLEIDSPEVACQGDKNGVITSGGGFSHVNSRPNWQTSAVAGYFTQLSNSGISLHSGFNTGGRGYPDLSAAGAAYIVYIGGSANTLYGTSASSPVVAGMISLVNAARVQNGLSTVGWINPALYALYKNFTNDIVAGNNKCTAYGDVCCDEGYYATTGWDPVTGLGSLNFTRFLQTFESLTGSLLRPTAAPTPAAKKPTASPTSASPTLKPTAAPTQASGWYVSMVYADGDCSGEPQYMFGQPTGSCIVVRSYTTKAFVFAYKVTCGYDTYAATLYHDSACTVEATTYSKFPSYYSYYYGNSNLGCERYNNGTDTAYSVKYMCTNSGSSSAPTTALPSGSYVVYSYYGDTTKACKNSPTYFYAEQNNYCYTSGSSSYEYQFPYYYLYNGTTTCSATKAKFVTTTTFSTSTCYNAPQNTASTTYFSSKISLISEASSPSYYPTLSPTLSQAFIAGSPTITPTSTPSKKPTPSPTQPPTTAPTVVSTVVVQVVQQFAGISYANYKTHLASFNAALQTSAAALLSFKTGKSITSNNIEIISVSNSSSGFSRRLDVVSGGDGGSFIGDAGSFEVATTTSSRQLSTSSIFVDYTVSSINIAYATVASACTSVLTSSNLTTSLSSATGIAITTFTPIVTNISPTASPTTSPVSTQGTSATQGTISSIIGYVIGIIIIVLGVITCARRRIVARRRAAAAIENNNNEGNNNNNTNNNYIVNGHQPSLQQQQMIPEAVVAGAVPTTAVLAAAVGAPPPSYPQTANGYYPSVATGAYVGSTVPPVMAYAVPVPVQQQQPQLLSDGVYVYGAASAVPPPPGIVNNGTTSSSTRGFTTGTVVVSRYETDHV